MLMRHCDRCDKIIGPKDNYSLCEKRFYNSAGGYRAEKEFDLCEKCSKELDEFLKGEGNK